MRSATPWGLAALLTCGLIAVAGCSEDSGGLGYCVVTSERATERNDGSEQGDLVQADSGCLANEVLVCGSFNSRDQFVSDDCADGVGAPLADG